MKRGIYNEIILSSLNNVTRKQITNLVNNVSVADKVDEHGNWEFSSEFDKKGRGYAINWDLYAFGKDYFNKKLLCVIQIRKYEKRRKNGFPNIRKSYFLLGRNEDKTVFAHAIESKVIHNAIKKGKDVIKAVQSWIFDCDYTKIIRQGDFAMIPYKGRISEDVKIEETEILLEKSHLLKSSEIFKNGSLIAKNPVLTHIPGTHPEISGKGTYKIIVGKRSKFWDFAAPTID